MSEELTPCGTYAAAQRHRKRGEVVDDACLKASSEYQREYRKSHQTKEKLDRAIALKAARQRALTRLGKLHAIDYMILYDEEQRNAGLRPKRETS